MIQLREADSNDAAVIALLARVTFTETFGHYFRDPNDLHQYLDQTFGVSKLQTSLSKPNNVFWLAYVDKLPVGYAKLKRNSPSPFLNSNAVCQLQKIYVLKHFLSQKVGLALQEILLKKAKEEGFQKIWLSVLKDNERAIRFYAKNGFDTFGGHGFSIGQENFEFEVMAKDLS